MDIISRMKDFGGYWRYQGGKYLAELASGKLSDLFCNTTVITSRPDESCLPEAAKTLAIKMLDWCVTEDDLPHRPDGWDGSDEYERQNAITDLYVCGPAFGGITLSYEVARQLGGVSIFTEPVYSAVGGGPGFVSAVQKEGQELKRFTVPNGSHMLFVEDVITTGKSTLEMMDAVWAKQDQSQLLRNLECILCLVNRSGEDHLELPNGDYWQIIALAEEEAHTWGDVGEAMDDLGIQPRSALDILEPVRPKDNWDKLNEG